MNTADLMQQDSQARDKIVEKIHSNFFVEAGAGSGKTTILVKRMVAMIEAGLLKQVKDGVKVLGRGELDKALTVKANKFSATAVEKIEKAGGKAEVI